MFGLGAFLNGSCKDKVLFGKELFGFKKSFLRLLGVFDFSQKAL